MYLHDVLYCNVFTDVTCICTCNDYTHKFNTQNFLKLYKVENNIYHEADKALIQAK